MPKNCDFLNNIFKTFLNEFLTKARKLKKNKSRTFDCGFVIFLKIAFKDYTVVVNVLRNFIQGPCCKVLFIWQIIRDKFYKVSKKFFFFKFDLNIFLEIKYRLKKSRKNKTKISDF